MSIEQKQPVPVERQPRGPVAWISNKLVRREAQGQDRVLERKESLAVNLAHVAARPDIGQDHPPRPDKTSLDGRTTDDVRELREKDVTADDLMARWGETEPVHAEPPVRKR